MARSSNNSLPRPRSAPVRSPLSRKPSGRSFIILLLAACGELASPAWAGVTPTERLVHWATDVRPALESVVCVALQEGNGRSVFQPSIAEPPGCPGPLPSDPALARVAHLLASRGVLARAKIADPSKAFGGIPVDAGHVPVAEQAYRTMVLAHSYVQDRLMPRIHDLLAVSGLVCPDCPGAKRLPKPRTVGYGELMPYILAYLRPVKVGPDGGFSMQICAGINGIQEIKAPDPILVDAGFDLVFGNRGAIDEGTRQARDAARSPECKKLDSEARVAYVRRYLAQVLPGDIRFQEALRPGIQNLPEIGIACSDCP